MVQFLIDKGANDWNLAMAWAARKNHLEMVQFFIDKGADYNSLTNAQKRLYKYTNEKLII